MLFKNYQLKKESELFKIQNKFQKEWEKIEPKIMLSLSEINETFWFTNPKEIIALVSLNPICPRDIKNKNFNVFYKQSIEEMKDTCIHELLHFIYFKKWKEVFPHSKEKEFDNPYLVWKLSEIVIPIILNEKRIQKIFEHKFKGYNEFEQIKIKGKLIRDSLQELYEDKENFEDFLKKSYAFIKKHKSALP